MNSLEQKGLMKLAIWLAFCLGTGWSKESLPGLEKIWWRFKDKHGNIKATPKH